MAATGRAHHRRPRMRNARSCCNPGCQNPSLKRGASKAPLASPIRRARSPRRRGGTRPHGPPGANGSSDKRNPNTKS
eukprot:5640755-Lingulodinium_polyedra.AAC.1